MHKKNFHLSTGECLNDSDYSIIAFEVKEENKDIYLLLPEPDDLDDVLGTEKWMVKAATSQLFPRTGATQVELVGPDGRVQGGCSGDLCSGGKLEW